MVFVVFICFVCKIKLKYDKRPFALFFYGILYKCYYNCCSFYTGLLFAAVVVVAVVVDLMKFKNRELLIDQA